MSHVEKLKARITDLGALREALKEFPDAELIANTACRWYGRSVGDTPLPEGIKSAMELETRLKLCPWVIRHPSAHYDIALLRQNDGSYALFYDSWGSSYGGPLLRTFGNGLHKLVQSYAKHNVTAAFRKHGYHVHAKAQPDRNGDLRMQVMRF